MPDNTRAFMSFPIDFSTHPKILPLSNSAFRLYISSIGWSAANGRRYWISRATRIALGSSKRSATELDTVGLWLADVVDGESGHWIVANDLWAVQSVHRDHIPEALRNEVLRRDGFKCVYCDATENLQMDHVFPWSLGGASTFENLQALCAPCNQSKGARI